MNDAVKNNHLFTVKKAGRLANGYESGKGSILHLTDSPYAGRALCGVAPQIQWIECPDSSVTCEKCLKKLKQGAVGA